MFIIIIYRLQIICSPSVSSGAEDISDTEGVQI